MGNPLADKAVIAAVGRAATEARALRLLFVCTGNICRSPLAHAVFDHSVHDRQLEGLFETESCGTHGYHVGDNADPRMRACARRHGIILDHGARKLDQADFVYFDLILAMDSGHLDWLRQFDRAGQAEGRMLLYREFDAEPDRGRDVPDPYYSDAKAFESVWQIVDTCTRSMLDALIAAMKNQVNSQS